MAAERNKKRKRTGERIEEALKEAEKDDCVMIVAVDMDGLFTKYLVPQAKIKPQDVAAMKLVESRGYGHVTRDDDALWAGHYIDSRFHADSLPENDDDWIEKVEQSCIKRWRHPCPKLASWKKYRVLSSEHLDKKRFYGAFVMCLWE